MNSNKKTLTAILILLVMCTGISISYAFFKVASSNNNANTNVTINGAALCMSLQLSSDNITISNEYAVPISDSKALSSDTYKTSVTITNNCNTSQLFNLLLVPGSLNTMPIKALKYALVEEGVTPTSGTLISNEYILDSTIQKQLLAIKNETLKNGFSVGSGTVSSGTKTYSLYLWIDKDEGSLGNGSTMNKSLNAYLTLGSGSVIGDLKLDLYHTIENRYNQDKTYLGLYNGEGADTYANPVYYYKGNVQNNNVLFGGFCWKIVRTTETGGVKIVYNGKPFSNSEKQALDESGYTNVVNDPTYPYVFDSTGKYWRTYGANTSGGTISFSPAESGNYTLNVRLENVYTGGDGTAFIYKNGTRIKVVEGLRANEDIDLGDLTSSNVIKVEFERTSSETSTREYIMLTLSKNISDGTTSCNNTGTDSQIGTSAFNNDYNSPAYVGYMHNTVYPYLEKSMSSEANIVFGNSFDYNSNNGTYTLKDTKAVTTWSSGYNTINNNHYTCMSTGTTCSSIYYVYYTNSSTAYYITLTGGKSINDALNEMLYADDVNTNDSAIKKYIDNWYENNLASYEDRLEDTVFCNDRSMSNESSNGWNSNGGSTSTILYFKNYSSVNQSLVCANETDRFSMSNSKAKLKHPIGLLSGPELSLAGTHYFNNGQDVWLASPDTFGGYYAYVRVAISGGLGGRFVGYSGGVRPSISLKPNTYFSSGDGSFTNPFVIGDAVEEPSGNSFDTVFAANNTDIFNEKGIRYEGADPKNYICLDNKTSGTCSDNSLLFRIIGLFDEEYSSDGTSSSGTKKLLKVIDTNNYGGTDGKRWNTAGTNNWSSASLKTELNGTYLDALLGTSNVNSKLSGAIANAKWHLGGASSSNSNTLTAEGIYTEERNTSAIYSGNPSSIYAKVGLMYPSDYGYATVGGTTTNRAGCRAKELFNWRDSSFSDCKNNDWLYTSQSSFANGAEWLLSPSSSSSLNIYGLISTGYVDLGCYVDNEQLAVRPTFYLDSSILKIVGGLGTKDNAYRIG